MKYRISEGDRASRLINAAAFLKDNVYTRTADLDTIERILSADLYYHNSCFNAYERKVYTEMCGPSTSTTAPDGKRNVYKKYTQFIGDIIVHVISLTDIREHINSIENIDLKNNELKTFLLESFGDEIQFCNPVKQNESLIVYSSSVDIQDVINTLSIC